MSLLKQVYKKIIKINSDVLTLVPNGKSLPVSRGAWKAGILLFRIIRAELRTKKKKKKTKLMKSKEKILKKKCFL